jgi:hypothetical protein
VHSLLSRCCRQSIIPMCFLLASVVTAVVGDETPNARSPRSTDHVRDYRRTAFHTLASRARRKLLLLASLDGRFSQPEAAIVGVTEEWLTIRNYVDAHRMLRGIRAQRMVGWTHSGFDLQGFESFWIVDTGTRQFVVWTNYDTLIVTSLTKEDVKSLRGVWQDFSKRIGKSHIEEPEKGMVLGGAVGAMTFKDGKEERFLFSYGGFHESTGRKWNHIFKHAKAVGKLVSSRTRASIESSTK